MTKRDRLLGVFPGLTFVFLIALSASVLLLEIFPRNIFLWWVNIEIFPEFRMLYRFLDTVTSRSLLMELVILSSAFTFTLFAARRRNLAALFLVNHLAALLILVPSLGKMARPAIAGLDLQSWPIADFYLDPGRLGPFFLILIIFAVISCGATHWNFLRRITGRE